MDLTFHFRGAGVFLYRGFGTVIRGCTVKNYNGDGISFQQSNDVVVENCTSEDNASLGIHPGSGSQRPVVRNCIARANGEDGLFLCWRVRHGLFEDNLLEANGRFGISIGHKDTDNLFVENVATGNGRHGLYFRDESAPMAGHRNRFVRCTITGNGAQAPDGEASDVRLDGETRGIVLEDCRIGPAGIAVGPKAEAPGIVSSGANIVVQATIGVALATAADETAEELIAAADRDMYARKRSAVRPS